METDQIKMADGIDTNHKIVTVMFADKESAECAYNDLLERGYKKDNISLAMSDETHKKHFIDAVRTKDSVSIVAEDAVIGGTIGAIIGAAVALGAIALPGLGLVLAGPIAAALAGAGAGGLFGGIVGALEGAGIPEAHARIIETGVTEGHIVIGFQPHNDEDAAFFEQKWKDCVVS